MSAKDVKFSVDARDRMLHGRAVRDTFGGFALIQRCQVRAVLGKTVGRCHICGGIKRK
jgi:hypothetical protein